MIIQCSTSVRQHRLGTGRASYFLEHIFVFYVFLAIICAIILMVDTVKGVAAC